MKMDNLDDSENNAKISDSAYSNSCSNSQSRRSHSSKSTRSGSHSSRSSGYGGNPLPPRYSNIANKPTIKRSKEKHNKRRKSQSKPSTAVSGTLVVQSQVKYAPPEPVKPFEIPKEEHKEVCRMSPSSGSRGNAVECVEITTMDMVSCKGKTESEDSQSLVLMNVMANIQTATQGVENFSCVISMNDGIVLHTTSSLTALLDYPKEMWIGKSFLEFIHKRDHNVFASQISSTLSVHKDSDSLQTKATTQVNTSSSIVCRLRRYRALSSGFGVKERSTTYMPFFLKFSVKEIEDKDVESTFLVVQATPFVSAFKMPNEVLPKGEPFVIKHTANGNMEYIDPKAVPYLGYLPQDLKDKNALNLYHPHDMDYLQSVYETTVKEGSVARGSAYRMLIQNGDYIKLESEWSSFINPWSRKLEFVIGKHHVVEGPTNPNVFDKPRPETMFRLSEDDKARTQCMRDNIVRILNEVPTKPAVTAKRLMSKRCQDLAAYVETLIEDPPKYEEDTHLDIQDTAFSFYERDSVMLGGISPHHDFSDGKSSSDAPLTYNQLNYNDTLQRYFDSHQSYAFEEIIYPMNGDNIFGNKDPSAVFGLCLSPLSFSEDAKDEDSPRSSSALAIPGPSSLVPQGYKHMRLTESALKKHNYEMEKELAKLHRETRVGSRSEREKATIENRKKKKEHLARCNATFQPTCAGFFPGQAQTQSLKRTSKTPEPEAVAHKHPCTTPRQRHQPPVTAAGINTSSVATHTSSTPWPMLGSENMNAYIVGMGVPSPMPIVNPVAAMPGYIPMYYAPISHPVPNESVGPSSSQMPYPQPPMQYMMYGQAMYPQIVYAPIGPHLAYGMQNNFYTPAHYMGHPSPFILTRRNYEEACKPGVTLKTKMFSGNAWSENTQDEPQGTLIKVNPDASGNSSADVSNRNAQPRPDRSRGYDRRPNTPSDDNQDEIFDRTDGESSYCSFYSSFFKTDSGSAEESDGKKSSGVEEEKPKFWTKVQRKGDRVTKRKQQKNVPKRPKDPPWMKEVCVTSELIYKYKVVNENLEEVLARDKEKLKSMQQSPMISDQLDQLYLDLQLEGVAARLTLEEGVTSSSSSDEDSHVKSRKNKNLNMKKTPQYSKLAMIYEEDAPLPPPEDESRTLNTASLFRSGR